MPAIKIQPWLVIGNDVNAALFWTEEEARANAAELEKLGIKPQVFQAKGSVYPPPERQPDCKCWPNLVKAMLCPHGHLTECHVGLDCAEAQCGHLHRYE